MFCGTFSNREKNFFIENNVEIYGQASYTDWLHFEKCPNVTNQGTIPTVVSPINVQCLSVYTDKHCTLIGDISK